MGISWQMYMCCSSTCCFSTFSCMEYGCTSPRSNGLTGGHTHLVAHLMLLWRDIQSWASLTVVFGSGPKETRSVYSFITMSCHVDLRHTPGQGSEQVASSISVNFNLPALCFLYREHVLYVQHISAYMMTIMSLILF